MKYQYFCGDEKQILIHITDYMIHAYGKHLNYLNLRIIKPYIQRHLMLFFRVFWRGSNGRYGISIDSIDVCGLKRDTLLLYLVFIAPNGIFMFNEIIISFFNETIILFSSVINLTRKKR